MNDTRANSNFAQFEKRKISFVVAKTVWYWSNVPRSNRHMHRLNRYLHIISICALPRRWCVTQQHRNYFCYFSSVFLTMPNKRHLNLLYKKLFIYFVSLFFRSRYFWRSFFREFMDYLLCFNCCLIFFFFGVQCCKCWCDGASNSNTFSFSFSLTLTTCCSSNSTYNIFYRWTKNTHARHTKFTFEREKKKWISLCLFHFYDIFLSFF